MLVIAAFLAVLYFLTAQPLSQADPTSRQLFNLTQALAAEHHAILDHWLTNSTPFLTTSLANGTAYFAGHYFSTIAPGLALLTVPFYLIGNLFGAAGATAFVTGLMALLGAGTVLLFYGFARRSGSAIRSARYAALTLGLASALWREAGRFGPGGLNLFLLTLALWLALPPLPSAEDQDDRQKLNLWRGVSLGLVLGWAVVVDYSNAWWTLVLLVYLVWCKRLTLNVTLWSTLGWLVGFAPLPLYNWLNFGRPWIFSYSFALGNTNGRSLVGQFLGGFAPGNFWLVLFGSGRGLLGLFVLLFGVWGLIALYGQRGKRPETLLCAALIGFGLVEANFRRLGDPGTLRIDYGLALLPALGLGVAVWHERFMFLTRLEQWWLPGLALFGPALYYWIVAPGWGANLSAAPYLLPLAVLVALASSVWWRTSNSVANWQKSYFGLALLFIIGGVFSVSAGAVRPAWADNGANNLLANGEFKCSGSNVPGWYVQGQSLKCPVSGQPSVAAGQQLQPYLAVVQGGKSYAIRFESAGPGRLDWLWLDDNQQPLALPGGEVSQGVCGGCHYEDERAAPPGASYLQLVFLAADAGGLSKAALFDNGLRLEPMPDYARSALAFSFDWESAMGGLIHSKGGGPANGEGESGGTAVTDANVQSAVNNAVTGGIAMRDGADNLLKLFQKFDVRGTFYATGYNLLDGNRDRIQFAGNPIYSWASPKNRWPSNYWQTHPWYGNDPYGDYTTDKAWYFGDQTNRLRDAGQDIQDHTFGHLYVRGTSLDEFQDDQTTFLQYADAKSLTIRHFAFPWKSSNSVKPEWYKWLADNGFQSITRQYDQDQQVLADGIGQLKFDNGQRNPNGVVWQDFVGPKNYYYYLRQAPGEPRLLALHDYQLVPGAASEAQARQLIDELMLRRGYGSIWTHPEAVVTPGDRDEWLRTVQYAVGKRETGLWVDSVANIIQRRLDTAQVAVSSEWGDNGHHLTITLTNSTDHALSGLTLTLPAAIKSVSGAASFKGAQVVAPKLETGQKVMLEVEL